MSRRRRYYRKTRIYRKRTIPKQGIREFGVVLLFCLLLPYVAATLSGQVGAGNGRTDTGTLFILMEDDNGTERIPVNTFLTGALAASMDTRMEDETLKAQAVLLRTAVWEAYGKRKDKADHFVLEQDLSQEYYSVYELQKNWKEDFEEKYTRLERLVLETDGVIMTYQGIPVKAPYFYVSAGQTRNGNEVYAEGEYPYLVSVESPQDMFCTEYGSNILFPERLFWEKTQMLFNRTENGERRIGQLRFLRDSAGYVSTVTWGDITIPGEAFREAFELPSSHFTLEEKPEGISITTQGIGHGLGFSQYGANEMAKKGKLCDEILKYYFHETEIENY